MDKAVSPLDLPSALPKLTPNNGSNACNPASRETRRVAFMSPGMRPRRSSPLSVAAPAPPPLLSRADTIETLRHQVLAIERPQLEVRRGIADELAGSFSGSITDPRIGPRTAAWSLGAPEMDALLGANALETAACHEVKPASAKAASRAAALAFALALARRRLEGAPRTGKDLPRILWCGSPGTTLDTGQLYPPGFARFGLQAGTFLFVNARREDEVLWTLEEGLRSGSLALVIGMLDRIGLTPARRLSLAARDGATPLLMLTSARAPVSGATATRWRIDPVASAAHPFDARTPGTARLAVRLERCRAAPPATEAALVLEWSNEACRFRVASAVADRTAEAAPARRRAG